MNWKRGLFRAWLIIAVCWIAATTFLWWDDLTCSNCAVINEAKKLSGYEETTSVRRSDGSVVAVQTHDHAAALRAARLSIWHEKGSLIVGMIIGPPFALILLGSAVLWIGRGFRPKT
jgi:hypothetical protein